MSDAIDPNRPYTSAQVATLVFGRSVAWFYSYRSKDAAREGFPRPISNRGWPRWAGCDLLAWITRPKVETALDAPPEGSGSNLVDIRAKLRARSRELARSRPHNPPQNPPLAR